jgi:hypothetical protein
MLMPPITNANVTAESIPTVEPKGVCCLRLRSTPPAIAVVEPLTVTVIEDDDPLTDTDDGDTEQVSFPGSAAHANETMPVNPLRDDT